MAQPPSLSTAASLSARAVCSFYVPGVGLFRINVFRLLWRSFYVVLTTLLAALLPARPPPCDMHVQMPQAAVA